MAQSAAIKLAGVLSAQPALSSAFASSFNELMPLDICAVYGAVKGGVIHVTGTDLSPSPIPLEGIIKGRLLALRLLSGATVKVRYTTGLGVAVLPVSNLWIIHAPAVGDEFTAVELVTAAGGQDVAYVLAGDTT